MANTKIRGNTQILDDTIENAQIAAAAAIDLSKLSETVIQADGGADFTADQSLGSNKITFLADGTLATDGVNKGQLDAAGVAALLAKLKTRETPTGLINGSNQDFTLSGTINSNTEQVFLNGNLQDEGASNDYTVIGAGTIISFIVGKAPLVDDKIRVTYISV